MAKRRVSGAQSDSEGSDAEATSSKRARVDDDAVEDETEEQKEFEARFGDKVRASIESKGSNEGRIAQHGIIQSLEMHQFMCHPRLSFIFGPQINFIIGHNGSGKSAVLSAITVALGGKATTTGRGSGLKSFIREGQSVSEVTVTIKNEGEDAFKPDVYGKSIAITRRFNKEGGSSYKIKSKDGKVISTKREELSAICDHMNIQVDNPMNILSQDSARQFLSSSHPTDKYEFFLKGTQLKQLSEEYEACLENIGKTYRVLEAKREVLPDLKRAVKDAAARFKGAQKAVQQKERMGELKKELAWSHVKEKEEEMSKKIEEVASVSRKIPKEQNAVKEAKALFDSANQAIVELENEIADLGDIDHLNKQKNEITEKIRANKRQIAQFQADTVKMNTEIKNNNTVIADYEQRIAAETKKLQEDKQAEREERERKIQAAKQDLDNHQAQLASVNDQLRDLQTEEKDIRQKIVETSKEKEGAEREMQHCAAMIDKVDQQARDSLGAYGYNLPEVLKRIESQRWLGERPKGPLGMFVSLREQQWANVMRITLGGLVRSFAITDPRDRNALKKILQDTNNGQMQIIVAEVDLFDFSNGEPPQNMLTALRALDFTDPYVMRIFINQSRLERTFLAPTRKDGQDIVDKVPGGGTAWTGDLFRVMAYGDGGYNSTILGKIDNRDPRMQLFTHKDPSVQKEQWKSAGRQANGVYDDACKRLGEYNLRLAGCLKESQDAKTLAKSLDSQIRELRRIRDALVNEHNDDVPVNIGALEEAMQEAIDQKQSVIEQFADLESRKSRVDAEQPPLMHELEAIKRQIKEFEDKKTGITEKVMKAADARVKAQHDLRHYEGKLDVERKKLADLEETAELLQGEYENWTKTAEDYCDGAKIENPRKKAEIERALKSVERALNDQQREQGATVEELETALLEAEQRYSATEKDLRDMANLNKVLKQSLIFRLARWHDFRRHIALRTKLQFQYHLSNRAYFGKVLFDHDSQKLQLKVQTDDQAQTQGLNKDPKSLSGGEKSFSTICLLLALWEAIGCPIRCLDEFDVFMDAVNRRISMKMMIETANSSDSKQYILITPQDMSNVAFGPSVRVHRMGDPERGQTTL